MLQALPSPAAAINPISQQGDWLLQADQWCSTGCWPCINRACKQRLLGRGFRSPTSPTKATSASTISSRLPAPGSCASATARETGVNFPALPLPLDGQTNGSIRVLDQQVALGYTHLIGSNKVLDARVGLSRTKAGKYTLSIGDNAITIPGLPTNPVVAGGLPSIAITGFTGFGRQSTNPQWQNPAVLDPKVNFTYVKGKHSLKFGYEYEHIWMAVNDNNPLYGSFT